jgi:hypothetical protein
MRQGFLSLMVAVVILVVAGLYLTVAFHLVVFNAMQTTPLPFPTPSPLPTMQPIPTSPAITLP